MPAELMTSALTLDQLLPDQPDVPAIPLTGISSDSRELAAGNLFLACQGATSHGLDFADQAIAAGVAAIAWDTATAAAIDADVPMIGVDRLAEKVGAIADRWFESPTSAVKVAGVTGTNGKTTVAYLTSQALGVLGQKCGYLGTLGAGIENIANGGYMTTPSCIDLHRRCAEFRDTGATHAALEISSHAIDQRRIDGLRFDVVVFTNLSRDHIDYHGSMKEYGATKARLILDANATHRIVNVDCEFGADLADRCGTDVIVVSTSMNREPAGRLHVFANRITSQTTGSDVSFTSSWGDGSFHLGLPGEFNVANALDVLATLLCWNVPLTDACAALARVAAPPGRMQHVEVPDGAALPDVYVDYSHTPASLEAALQALRAHCSGQLWCVFGCGGDRDRGKRPMMGKVAARFADVTVVTSDNPRTESPGAIIADILAGMAADTTAIEDRATAIDVAVTSARAGDIVLIAGKGHEHYQVIGNERIRFSDYETARDSLSKRALSGVSP